MGENAKLFRSLLCFYCFSIGNSSKIKKKKKTIFPDLKGKRPKDKIEEKIVVKPSKSINQMDVDAIMQMEMEIYFPEEIIVEILIRLPVRSLLRSKCVSKSWNTLISDPKFKAKHCHHVKNNKKFLIGLATASYFSSSLSSSAQPEPLQKVANPLLRGYLILCCCDSLVLLCNRGDYLLWNPSTNESVQLPNHEFLDRRNSTYGLGYDSISHDYKILMIDDGDFDSRPLNKILALKSGSSRNIDNHPRGFRNIVCPDESLAFVRGAFHWICVDNLSKYFMISFDISNEVYGEISLPEGICNISDVCKVKRAISVLDGMLCAHCTFSWRGEEAGTFKLWVMKDYGVKESWTELFTIREPSLYLAIPRYMFADGEVLLFYDDGHQGFRTSKGPFELLSASPFFLQGFVYTESLISPKLFI